MASLRAFFGALLFVLSQAATAQVELLYISAADCGFCRRWEAQYLDGQKPKPGLDWSHVRFTLVDIGTFRAPYGAANVPPRLRPGVERILGASGRSSLRGTPWFALFVNGEVRVHAFGVNAFETRIQPAILAALLEKT